MNLVLDNIIFSLQRTGGISAVWANLIDNLSQRQKEFKCLEYGDSQNIYRHSLHIPEKNIIRYNSSGLAYNRYFNPVIDVDSPAVFHSSYYRTVKSPLVKNVSTVHDFTYEYFVHGPRAWIHRWQKFDAIRNSDQIVCISRNTRDDLLQFLPDISPAKVSVIYNGVSNDYYPLRSVKDDLSDYLMFVGARDGYKNFRFTVEVAKETRMRLLICGAPLTEQENKLLNSKLGPTGFIVHVRPSNTEMNEYYNSVGALIYPSSYEGFGIPVLEAQRAGCPVIALNASSIPEIIGRDYPLLPVLTLSAASKLITMLKADSHRNQIINIGLENSGNYSWSKMGQQYIDLYHSLS